MSIVHWALMLVLMFVNFFVGAWAGGSGRSIAWVFTIPFLQLIFTISYLVWILN